MEYYKNVIELLEAWNKEFQKENENQKTKIEQQKRDLDKALNALENALNEPKTSEQSSDVIQKEWAGRLAEKVKELAQCKFDCNNLKTVVQKREDTIAMLEKTNAKLE